MFGLKIVTIASLAGLIMKGMLAELCHHLVCSLSPPLPRGRLGWVIRHFVLQKQGVCRGYDFGLHRLNETPTHGGADMF
jgi:hypothetical protein